MMAYWRQNKLYQPVVWLLLLLMLINPAMAMQYQQLNTAQDFLKQLPDGPLKTFHIHVSQKAAFLKQIRQQGYETIPASQQDIDHFLHSKATLEDKPIQLAANFNLKSVYEKDCPVRSLTCYREECDKYTEQRPNCKRDDSEYKKPERKAKTSRNVNVNISRAGNIRLPRIGGGSSRDAGAAILVVIGVVVIAAVFIYAGKWIADALKNDEDYYSYWWDIGANFTSLDTDTGEHGSLNSIKFSGGFVPNMHTNFGLALELGQMDLNLLYNKNTEPTRINVEGSYWLLGPSVRWLLGYRDTEKLVNNSYFHFELLGGDSDQKQVDKIVVGRVGFNTGIGEHMRLGIHYGAFYLGMEEDEGIANDGDNYWTMLGLEIGYQF